MRLIFKPHPLSLVNYDPTGITEILALVAAVSAIGGVATSIAAASNKPKSPSVTAPVAPTADSAQAAAEASQLETRKTFLASGGQTDFTGGLGVLTGTDTAKSTLLGSS